MRPVKALSACSTASTASPLGSATTTGSASASSVAVTYPRWMSATYVLGSVCANSASLVADSNRMGSTPVASGSSVPAWPTRWAPVRRLSRMTTENEVSPASLSTLRTPVVKRAASGLGRGGKDGLLGGRQDELHRIFHRTFYLRPRGADVTASAEGRAKGCGVDRAAAAHADLGELA